jgi:hypothetical protein
MQEGEVMKYFELSIGNLFIDRHICNKNVSKVVENG